MLRGSECWMEAACVTEEEKARENFAIEPVDQALALAWIP